MSFLVEVHAINVGVVVCHPRGGIKHNHLREWRAEDHLRGVRDKEKMYVLYFQLPRVRLEYEASYYDALVCRLGSVTEGSRDDLRLTCPPLIALVRLVDLAQVLVAEEVDVGAGVA